MGASPSPAPPAPSPPIGSPTVSPVTPYPTCETTGTPGVPQLMVTVADVDDAGTGDEVFARVLYEDTAGSMSSYAKGSKGTSGGKQTSTVWSEWALLGHENCKDLTVSKTEYFDEFSNIESPWLAVALYNCGDDDVVIDTIGVWQGDDVDPLEIDYFCPNIAGPSTTCAEDETGGAIGTCYSGSDMEPFDFFRVDQDTCGALAFETSSLSTSNWPIATAYITDDPGIPDCTVSSMRANRVMAAEVAPELAVSEPFLNLNLDGDMATMAAVPAAVLLTAGLTYLMCFRKSGKKETEYTPLPSSYGTN